MRSLLYIALLLSGIGRAQTLPDFVQQLPDSVRSATTPTDTTGLPALRPVDRSGGNLDSVQLSQNAVEDPITYTMDDSLHIDNEHKLIHLYGNAVVTYSDINITADHIILDWNKNIVLAEGMPDSLGNLAGTPDFVSGSETFGAGALRYNFKNRKGIVIDARTQYTDITVRGGTSKFVSADPDDTLAQNVVYNSDAIFTTCDLDHPHFGIRSRKQKLIGDKMVVIGGSNLEIKGVPTPLFLPFGFFPLNTKTKQTGLIFPRDYEYSEQFGFGFRNVGWYFPINDYMDLTLTGDIYVKGTFAVNPQLRYARRYKHRGQLNLGFSSRRSEIIEIDEETDIRQPAINREPSFVIRWTHNQDAKAHPTRSFGGSVNIQTNQFQQRNLNTADAVLAGQLTSNLSYRQSFPGTPINPLTVSLNHSQNTQTRQMKINFPNVAFRTKQMYPFRRRTPTGGRRWYEDITVSYQNDIRNQIEATDTTLFDRETLEDMRFGVQQRANVGTSFKLFKYFNLNPSANYREVWYLSEERRFFDPTLDIAVDTVFNPEDPNDLTLVNDTLRFGSVLDSTLRGFTRFNEYSAGVSINTVVYGTALFRNDGWLRGIRHVAKPTLSFRFAPDYTNPALGYVREVQTDVRFPDDRTSYNVFSGQIFGQAPSSIEQRSLSYNITNLIEAKVFSKKDSTEKKVVLFRNIGISGNYNFAADSLNWSPVRGSGTTSLFNGITNINFGFAFDPYATNATGRTINRFYREETGRLLRFDAANVNVSTRITVAAIRDLIRGVDSDDISGQGAQRGPGGRPAASGRGSSVDPGSRPRPGNESLLDVFERFSINHQFNIRWDDTGDDGVVQRVTTNAVSTRGSIALTPNWAVTVGNIGYDFSQKRLTYPDLGFSRDLHCWEMSFRFQPQRGTYFFTVRAKSPKFEFLKVPYQRGNQDAFGGF